MSNLPTKERILAEASRLFAQKSYDTVSVEEIAQAVGIKAPSLYKHYKNKQEIFDAVVQKMNNRYKENMAKLQMNGQDSHTDMNFFERMTEEQLVELGKNLFAFFLHDDYATNFRKLLTIEQFQHSALAAMFTKQYADDPLSYQGMLFSMLMQAGVMQPSDPQIMALQFYAPIHLLLTICDRHPEREAAALQTLEQHIRQFNKLYRTGETTHG